MEYTYNEKVYPIPPADVYSAVGVDVIDAGMMENLEGKLVPKMRVVWQLDEVDETTGKRFEVSQLFTVSIHDRSNLFKVMNKWFGFTQPSNGTTISFDELIIGRPCQLQVVHRTSTSNGKTYANVASVVPLIKGMKGIEPKDYVRRVAKDKNLVGAGVTSGRADYDDSDV